MSRSPLRSLRLQGKLYRWRVVSQTPHTVELRLWRDPSRQLWTSLSLPFDDPWLNLGPMLTGFAKNPEPTDIVFQTAPVTPSLVATIIRWLESKRLSGRIEINREQMESWSQKE